MWDGRRSGRARRERGPPDTPPDPVTDTLRDQSGTRRNGAGGMPPRSAGVSRSVRSPLSLRSAGRSSAAERSSASACFVERSHGAHSLRRASSTACPLPPTRSTPEHPPRIAIRQALVEDGRIPLWNPYPNGGTQLGSTPSSGIFSPIVWPEIVLGIETGAAWAGLLRMTLAALGGVLPPAPVPPLSFCGHVWWTHLLHERLRRRVDELAAG